MKWADKQWTISDYLLVATAFLSLVGSGITIYVVSVTNDVRSSVNDEWQKKDLTEFNARMLNLNERVRDGFKEVKQEIKESDEKNLGKEAFENFKEDNNRRWIEINQDMQYLRSMKQLQVSPQPVYQGEEYKPQMQNGR